MEKKVKICDSCDTQISTQKCSICGNDLCDSCTNDLELKKPNSDFIKGLNLTFSKGKSRSSIRNPVCDACENKIMEFVINKNDRIEKLEVLILKQVKEYIVESGI